MIAVVIPGEPVAQGRPRAGKSWAGKTTLRDPEKSRNYKRYVHAVALQQKVEKPLEGALHAEIIIYKSVPASWSNKKKQQALRGELLPTVKGDLDNYCKSVLDAISGVIYEDDKQICSLTAKKFYSDEPRVELMIKPLF